MDETGGESRPLDTKDGGIQLPSGVMPLATKLSQESMTDIEDTLSKATNVTIEKHFNNEPYCCCKSFCCGMYPWFVVKVGERKLFIVKFTETNCCDRKCFPYYRFCLPCCCPSQHAHLKMKYLKPGEDPDQYSQPGDLTDAFAEVYAMDRICCLACCSPDKCFYEKHYLETAEKNPNAMYACCCNPCCGPNIEIRNQDESVKYVVTGSCLQCGYCCGSKMPLCCTRMRVELDINNDSGNRVGGITKPDYSCQCFTYETFDYAVDFPNDASFENKLQIVMSTIMFDCQYFQILPRC